MKCPICNVTMLLAKKQEIDINYCPQCRGTWLDKGKLDKIADKVASSNNGGYVSDSRHYNVRNIGHDQDGHWRKKELFNFFG